MQWYIFALISPFLWAVSNHTDKYILGRYFKNASTTVLIIFSGIVGILFPLFILLIPNVNIQSISIFHAGVIIFDGALYIIAFLPYYYALKEEEASTVAPLFQAIPVFSFILGYLIFHETITIQQIFAGILIIVGSIFISIDLSNNNFKLKKRVLLLMLLSSFLLSLYYFIFKVVALEESFFVTAFWEFFGGLLVSIFIFTFIKKYRIEFIQVFKANPLSIIFINIFNEGINIIAGLAATFATLSVPVVMVNLISGTQPFFVFIIGIIITIFFPFIGKEVISKKQIVQKVISMTILLLGTYLLIV